MELLNKQIKVKVSKSNLEGYGKVTITDKSLESFIGKEVELDIRIHEVK